MTINEIIETVNDVFYQNGISTVQVVRLAPKADATNLFLYWVRLNVNGTGRCIIKNTNLLVG